MKIETPQLRGVKAIELVKTAIILSDETTNQKFNRVEFSFDLSKTSKISSLNMEYVDLVRKGDLVTINGQNFDTNCDFHQVEIGNESSICELLKCEFDHILCRLPAKKGGLSKLSVKHHLFGKDKSYSYVDYAFGVSQISPLSGGELGGNEIMIMGYGFGDSESSSVSIYICDNICEETSYRNLETSQVIQFGVEIYLLVF